MPDWNDRRENSGACSLFGLDEQTGYDLGAYLANVHQIVLATEE